MNSTFQKKAGYDDNDFRRRVNLLGEFIYKMVSEYNVAVINIQEISSRHIHAEEFRYSILTKLFNYRKSWTATHPVGRHGNHTNCLNLMTFWDANILHLNRLINLHFSDGSDRDVGDTLCADKQIYATSNAIVMDMSFTVPEKSSEYHTRGFSMSVRRQS